MTAFKGYSRLAPLVVSALMLIAAGCSLESGSQDSDQGSGSQNANQESSSPESGPQDSSFQDNSQDANKESGSQGTSSGNPSSTGEQDTASVRVDPDNETELQVPDGPRIVLPEGSTSGSGELVADKPEEDAPQPPTDIVSASGGAWDIHLEDTELTGSAELQFPVQPPEDVPAEYAEMLLTYYDQQQGEWVPVESEYNKRQQTVTATVDHLSWWNPVTWDYQGLRDTASSELGEAIAGEEPEQPQCPNEDLARADGINVDSADGSRIKWCFGQDDEGKLLLRVTNGRGYPAWVTYPEDWKIQRQRSDSTLQSLSARTIESITAVRDDREGVMLDKGQMVTLYPERVPGEAVYVGSRPSSGGYILDNLAYAGDTVTTMVRKTPGASQSSRLTTKVLKNCAPELADTTGAGIVDQDTREIYTQLGEESLDCAAGQAGVPTQAKDFFTSGMNWLADGSQQVVAGARGVIDTARDPYWISIAFPEESGTITQQAKFSQTWTGTVNDSVSEYKVKVDLIPISEMDESMVGEVVGRSELSLGCTGEWTLTEVNEDSVELDAEVRSGFVNCVDADTILTPQPDGSMNYKATNDNDSATGVLTQGTSYADGTCEPLPGDAQDPDCLDNNGQPTGNEGEQSVSEEPEQTSGGSGASGNPQCIDGILDSNGDGQISPIEAAQAGADATQGEGPCSEDSEDSNENSNSESGEDTNEGSGEEASLDQAVGDYYRAVGAQEWAYTYDHLDSRTQSMFTEEEWSQKNQWFWDRNPTVYHILSVESDGDSEGSVAEVEVRITGEGGSSSVRTTYFVQEDGEWKHRFSEAETDLFMPDATFEEFVEAQAGTSP